MPIVATRLVNPPSRRRKSKRYPGYTGLTQKTKKRTKDAGRSLRGIRAVHTPSGIRYLSSRGRFVSAAKATRNPTRRRRRTRRNQASEALKQRLAALRGAGVDVAGAARKAREKAAKAAKRRKKTTSKRSKTVAKKRRMPPRTKSGRFRKVKKAKRRTSRKRTYRSRPRHNVAANPRRRRRRRTHRNPVSMNPRRRRTRRRRRNPMVALISPKTGRMIGVSLSRTSKGKAKRYRVRSTKKIRGRRRWSPSLKRVGRNPLGVLKAALPIYGGVLAIRVVSGLLKKYVADKYATTLGQAAPYVPAGLAFLFGALAAPKIRAISSRPKLLQGIQLGATFALGDVLIRNLIQKPMLASQTELVKTIGEALAGYDDLGVQGYGYGAYLADPTGYSLPLAHRTMEPSVGLDAQEAMALDEYVSDVGYNVNEALAGTEADYIQRGGAGGSLSRTVFSD